MHDADGQRIIGMERHPPDQQFVEHNSQTIQIRSAVDRPPARLLRTHVMRRADHGAGARHVRGRIVGAGDAEIGQRRGAVFAHQDIVGLDVAMHEAFGVRIIERSRNFAHHAQGERDRPRLAVLAQDRAATEILHRDVVIVARAADIMHADDIAVMQLGCDPRLAQEAFAEIRIGQQGRRHDLERDIALDRFLGGQVHGRHAATAELALDVVAGDYDHVAIMFPQAADGKPLPLSKHNTCRVSIPWRKCRRGIIPPKTRNWRHASARGRR